jgi:hypothetical protein
MLQDDVLILICHISIQLVQKFREKLDTKKITGVFREKRREFTGKRIIR